MTSGCINLTLAQKSTYREFPAESAPQRAAYLITHSGNVFGGGSQFERPQRVWIEMIIHTNDSLAVNYYYLIHFTQLLNIQ
jgi:hypothetical protein